MTDRLTELKWFVIGRGRRRRLKAMSDSTCNVCGAINSVDSSHCPTPPDAEQIAREAARAIVREWLDNWLKDTGRLAELIASHIAPLVHRAEQAESRVRDREAEILRLRTAENHAACELERLKAPGGELAELRAMVADLGALLQRARPMVADWSAVPAEDNDTIKEIDALLARAEEK